MGPFSEHMLKEKTGADLQLDERANGSTDGKKDGRMFFLIEGFFKC